MFSHKIQAACQGGVQLCCMVPPFGGGTSFKTMNSFYGCIYVCWSQRLNYVSYREIWLSVKAPEESLAQLKSYAKQFYKNLIYYFSREKNGAESAKKNIRQQDKISRKRTNQCYTRGTWDVLSVSQPECLSALGLITPVSSRGKFKFPGT